MYCLDLRFWYPGPQYKYKPTASVIGFKNRAGETVSVSNLQKAAYAIWTYGRTTNPNQAAAVMLYVHSLMGDARPGELDPAALNPSVVDLHAVVAPQLGPLPRSVPRGGHPSRRDRRREDGDGPRSG